MCKEKRAIKMRKKHFIGMLMADNGLKLTTLVLTLPYTCITELKWGTTLEGAEKSME